MVPQQAHHDRFEVPRVDSFFITKYDPRRPNCTEVIGRVYDDRSQQGPGIPYTKVFTHVQNALNLPGDAVLVCEVTSAYKRNGAAVVAGEFVIKSSTVMDSVFTFINQNAVFDTFDPTAMRSITFTFSKKAANSKIPPFSIPGPTRDRDCDSDDDYKGDNEFEFESRRSDYGNNAGTEDNAEVKDSDGAVPAGSDGGEAGDPERDGPLPDAGMPNPGALVPRPARPSAGAPADGRGDECAPNVGVHEALQAKPRGGEGEPIELSDDDGEPGAVDEPEAVAEPKPVAEPVQYNEGKTLPYECPPLPFSSPRLESTD